MSRHCSTEAEELRQHWDAKYHAAPFERLSWYQSVPQESLRLIEATGIARDAPVIDAGGGASLLAETLVNLGYADITIVDCSQKALDEARNRISSSASRVAWICADIRTFRSPKKFSLWHDRAVFHFMTGEDDRRRYLASLDACLDEDGVAIIGTFATNGPERCSGLTVQRYDAALVSSVFAPRFKLVSSSDVQHLTPSGSTQEFAWFTFRRTNR
ncbi:Methyltransferase type 12 [Chlorobaculum parvum NCIB 8327]|uniref:Methyltransferase type 12 n=1 Tax=Chlorobaculum parvum (strain DSM 263 / NCIMB 8327) TaxID=517417 RepID=B3QNU5_CHLP8|nr:class I SAM-dependent methyltransferase [Chlorobaculum parvum]ACF11598.1 Methyltransferase type 12 [Chlorobaculum parvum NCIB 8327]